MKDNFEDNLQSSSEESQSEDDEDGWKLTEEVEKEFYKTLSQIKNKDPKIYKKDVEFFKGITIPEEKKPKKDKALTLRDYERKIIVEKGGELSDEEPLQSNYEVPKEPTYVEEQESLKNSLKAALNSDSEDEGEWGGLLKKREKTEEDKREEEESYKIWLKGQKSDVPDKEVKEQMKPLQEFWSNPELDQGEQFLRDYVLNKKYLDHCDDDDRNLDESDDALEKNEEKCSHRFEEQDQEFIKRYPRNMENSVRRKKDHRKQKRDEIKERKLKEKEKKMVEIKQKKKLKRKQIEEKLEELKKLTGNEQLAFESVLGKDFDLDEHDKAMQRLFNEEFYSQDDPSFAPNDQETWNDDWYEEPEEVVDNNEEINCEDPNFNMDCDYDPAQHKQMEKSSRSRRRKDKHKRTTVSEAVNKEKPLFDPMTHESFQQYIDQYYSIDCEDFIGDLACRFKYRRTVPNSYGLTVEEILAADEKELERWCSIKRIHQLRPENKEKGDVKVYKKKASDEALKRKILPSLFKKVEEEKTSEESQKKKKKNKNSVSNHDKTEGTSIVDHGTNTLDIEDSISTNKTNDSTQPITNQVKKKKKPRKAKQIVNNKDDGNNNKNRKRKLDENKILDTKKRKLNKISNNNTKFKSKKKNHNARQNNQRESSKNDSSIPEMTDARLLAYGIKPKKFRNKLKYSKS